ncbi:MAG TPA: hypothetical protein VLE99_04165 [Candidatus Saccharimonadales bacterium]|nr:hypothetical protein [Candidatus Saccharimonadales bacterium]
MSKPQVLRRLTEKNKAAVVVSVTVALAIANLFPFHYARTQTCPHGGTYLTTGRSMGLPLSYFRTAHGSVADCPNFIGTASEGGFSAQALVGDALIFGVVVMSLNLLSDRRTKA